VKIGKFPLSANPKAIISGQSKGMVKIIAEKRHGQILGVHILGPGVTELITTATLAMKLEATTDELVSILYPHPSLSEALGEAALDLEGNAIHFFR
jgi:dihydrolipoamide dehydrogenase